MKDFLTLAKDRYYVSKFAKADIPQEDIDKII